MNPTIMTGVGMRIALRLKINSATFSIASSSDVTAAITSLNHSRKLTPDIVVDDTPVGSNWSASLIVVEIPGADTADIPLKDAKANLVVVIFDSDGFASNPFIIPVNIVKGHIFAPVPAPGP